MYTLACKDMGMMDCPFVAKGNSPEEAMKASMGHAMGAHANELEKMKKTMSEGQMMDAMKKAVKKS